MTLFLCLVYAAAALGTYATARPFGVSRDAALLAGLLWPLTAVLYLGVYFYYRHFVGGPR